MQRMFYFSDQFSFICVVLASHIICHVLFNSHAHRVARTFFSGLNISLLMSHPTNMFWSTIMENLAAMNVIDSREMYPRRQRSALCQSNHGQVALTILGKEAALSFNYLFPEIPLSIYNS